MSVELISVLVAVLAIGATLAGVILTSNRGGGNPAREKTMKYAVLFVFFSAAFAMGQDRIGQIPPKHIVGGEDAISDEFPFVAKIIYSGNQVGCTGSLIAPDKVLTAGHCVSGYSNISVGFGDTRTLKPRHQVAHTILHPEYSSQVNDIAILQLESAVSILPVRILTLEEELQYAPSGAISGVAVGWGSTHRSGGGGTLPRTLQKVTEIPIYTHEDCRRVLDELRSQGKKPGPPSIHEKILCAGEEGRATGQGDSGGPLLVQTLNGWAQVGVLSQVTRDPSPQTTVYMGQWTRTSYFRDWVYTASPAPPAQWLKEDNGQYTIYYRQEYEQDVEFVRTWMDRAESLMLDKYGLQRHGYDISIYLPSAPTQHAGRGQSTLICCRSDGTGEIHYLTPSAPAYGEGTLGTLRLSADDYHSKTLVHEYITVGHIRIAEGDKSRGFQYFSAPSWFVQGLQEYDGTFHSTESNRTTGYERLLDYAERSLQDTFYNFGSSSIYFGGLLLQRFLAEQYGEGIHLDLLTSEQPTFDLALDEQLAIHGRTASEAFDDFQRWFQTKLSEGIGPPLALEAFNLYFAHSAAGGGWRTDLVLLNTNPEMAEATVEVFGQDGGPRTEEQFSLRELSVVEWTLPEGEAVETGGVVVSSTEKLAGFLRFRYSDGSATSVQSAPVGDAFMVPVSNQVDRVGLAVFNADDKNLTVVFRMGERALYKTIPAQGKLARFADELFPGLSEPSGVLIVQTDPSGGQITVLALELINGNLVTLPAVVLE